MFGGRKVKTLLDATARVYALICDADGRVTPLESRRFVSFAREDPGLAGVSDEAAQRALAAAIADIAGPRARRFDAVMRDVARVAASNEERQILMRACQYAIIADRTVGEPEEARLRAISDALGLDPDKF